MLASHRDVARGYPKGQFMRKTLVSMAFAAAMITQPTTALAKDPIVQAVQLASENIRYDRGVPIVEVRSRNGAVQIQPLAMDHGSLVFNVAVFNGSNLPATIDANQIVVRSDSKSLAIFTVDKLMSKAKSRARWSQFGHAMLGAVASSFAANQQNTYRATTLTPYGSYHTSFTAPSLAGQIQADRISNNTDYKIGRISAQLDQTRSAISENSLQLTSVDPGRSYGGKIVIEKFKPKSLPQRVDIVLDWNGERYEFAFQVAKSGTVAPFFKYNAPSSVEPAVQRDVAPASPAPTVLALAGPIRQREKTEPMPYRQDRHALVTSHQQGEEAEQVPERTASRPAQARSASKVKPWGLVAVEAK